MEDAKTIAMVATAVLCFVLFVNRRLLFDFSCAAVFFQSYLLFVCVGVFLSPWLMSSDYIAISYSWFNFSLITEGDLIGAIWIVTAGLVMFLVGHGYTEVMLAGHGRRRWGELLRMPKVLPRENSHSRLRIIFIWLCLASVALLATQAGAVYSGLAAFFSNNAGEWYSARIQIAELGRVYFILVYNGLPFAAIAMWLQYRYRPGTTTKLWAWGAAVVTALFLFLTFQKTPLLLFILCLCFANIVGGLYAGRIKLAMPNRFPSLRFLVRQPLLRKFVVIGLVLFVMLVLFYKLTMGDVPLQFVITVAFDRIFGRLSIMTLMYAHFFPTVAPHYGLSNIGMLSAVLDRELYQDTIEVIKYFDKFWADEGSGAINAIYDFYGGFGWPGVFIGCFGLGCFINLLDRWLVALPPSSLNRALYIYMLVFSYYLSQASVPRSLSTYGGAFFIMFWLLMKMRVGSPVIRISRNEPIGEGGVD